MSDPIDEIVNRHIARSLDDLREPGGMDRWSSGERAKEQADEIIASVLAEARKRLEQEKNQK